jgi:hypothetical protein
MSESRHNHSDALQLPRVRYPLYPMFEFWKGHPTRPQRKEGVSRSCSIPSSQKRVLSSLAYHIHNSYWVLDFGADSPGAEHTYSTHLPARILPPYSVLVHAMRHATHDVTCMTWHAIQSSHAPFPFPLTSESTTPNSGPQTFLPRSQSLLHNLLRTATTAVTSNPASLQCTSPLAFRPAGAGAPATKFQPCRTRLRPEVLKLRPKAPPREILGHTRDIVRSSRVAYYSCISDRWWVGGLLHHCM